MKWIVLIAAIMVLPVLVQWLKANPKKSPIVSMVLGFLPFVFTPWHLSVSPISWALWPGYVDGMEITLLDLVALAIVLSGTHRKYTMPFNAQMLFYFFAVLITVPLAKLPMSGIFYVWQVLRAYLVFRAVALVATDQRHRDALITGMILGLAFQACEAGLQRAQGRAQSGGSLGHQNLLGSLTHLVLLPSLGLFLAGHRVKWAALGMAAGAAALIFGASRASIGFSGAGVIMVILLSVLRNSTGRKMGMVAVVVAGIVIATPFAFSSLSNRFGGVSPLSVTTSAEEERAALERGARAIIADHPMGIAPNNYAVVANTEGYSSRAGVNWVTVSHGANVHNSYLLIRAETGFLGLASALLLIASMVTYPILIAFRNRQHYCGDLPIGLGCAAFVFALHQQFEWGYVSDTVQYMLAINMGLSAAFAQAIKFDKMKTPASGGARQRQPVIKGLLR